MNNLINCPDCCYEWSAELVSEKEEVVSADLVVKNSNGAILQNGDLVVVIKDLPLKGYLKNIKVGAKVKNIKLLDSDHNIDCKIEGFRFMALKSIYVKKA